MTYNFVSSFSSDCSWSNDALTTIYDWLHEILQSYQYDFGFQLN